MTSPEIRYYQFGPFRVDVAERVLLRHGERVALTPKAFDALVLLVDQANHTLDRASLQQALWPDTFVEENNLTQCISAIRKALGDGQEDARFIETVPRRGYQFVAPVTALTAADAPADAGEPKADDHVTAGRGGPRTARLRLLAACALLIPIAAAAVFWRSEAAERLLPRTTEPIAPGHTRNAAAYAHFVKGRAAWNLRTGSGLHTAIAEYERAIALDGSYALAYAALADVYAFDLELWPKALEMAQTAIRLDPSRGEPHASIGFVRLFHQRDVASAERELKRAIELSPSYATGHQWYGIHFVLRWRHREAQAELRRALDLDPRSLPINADLAQVLYFSRKYDQALAQCQAALRLDPAFLNTHFYLYEIYSQLQRDDEAVRAYFEYHRLDGVALNENPESVVLHEAYAKGGINAFRRKRIELLSKFPPHPYEVAEEAARLGDTELALSSLERAVELKPLPFRMLYLGVDPVFAGVASDQRFHAVVKRVF